jgi:hypothetical protein
MVLHSQEFHALRYLRAAGFRLDSFPGAHQNLPHRPGTIQNTPKFEFSEVIAPR